MLFFTLFRHAGATGQVFLAKGGKLKSKGLAWSGFIAPWTTVAVVPTTPQTQSFSIEARTCDKQTVRIVGDIKVVLDPETAASKFDFTMDPKQGSYKKPWEQDLHACVIAQVLVPLRDRVKDMYVANVVTAHAEIMNSVKSALTDANNPFSGYGIRVESCSIEVIEATDDEVANSIGATARQLMLTDADSAVHKRQMQSVENTRAVQTFEAETKKKLEEKRKELIEAQSANKQLEAAADAEAARARFAPMMELDPGQLLAMSIKQLADSGRVGTLNISPDLITAVNANTRAAKPGRK